MNMRQTIVLFMTLWRCTRGTKLRYRNLHRLPGRFEGMTSLTAYVLGLTRRTIRVLSAMYVQSRRTQPLVGSICIVPLERKRLLPDPLKCGRLVTPGINVLIEH